MSSALKSLSPADLVAAVNELLAAVRRRKEKEEGGGEGTIFCSSFSFRSRRPAPPPPKKKNFFKTFFATARPRCPQGRRRPRGLQGHPAGLRRPLQGALRGGGPRLPGGRGLGQRRHLDQGTPCAHKPAAAGRRAHVEGAGGPRARQERAFGRERVEEGLHASGPRARAGGDGRGVVHGARVRLGVHGAFFLSVFLTFSFFFPLPLF